MNLKQITLIIGIASTASFTGCSESGTKANEKTASNDTSTTAVPEEEESNTSSGYTPTDTALYNKKMKELANGDTTGKWPVKNQPYPLPGAILPFKRVVTFYGNLYSKKMGALGEYAPKEMLRMLYSEVAKWEKVDPKTPVQPALHYIAVVAAGDKGKDGKYRNRMPDKQIDSVFKIAAMKKDMIVFLDIQVALSTIKEELPRLEKYLMRPDVHLGIDPEFSMKGGILPGKKIGTYDASEINYASDYLAKLVRTHKLPPKIFVIHRFTGKMVTNYKNIKLRPEVQIVMHMDGWGEPELKMGTHRYFIYNEPVQFTGFKIFYKNDLKKAPNRLMTPAELMKFKPQPSYIQYQ